MNIKTTINIKKSLFNKISAVASQFDVSSSFIVNSLARKALKYNAHNNCFLQRVHYQDRLKDESDAWRRMAVSFLPDVYEKCLDVRKLSKVSVSLFLSCAYFSFLDELIKELEGKKEGDNYSANYLLFYTRSGYFNQITLVWDIIEPEKLAKIEESQRE